jgi:hypothetical protein
VKKIIVIAALLLSTLGIVPQAHAGWEQNLTLTSVQFDGNNKRVLLYVAESVKNPAGCSQSKYYEIPSTASPFELGRVALAAYLAGKKVTLAVSDSACGRYGAPVVTFISVWD